jgi:hypothetical protein
MTVTVHSQPKRQLAPNPQISADRRILNKKLVKDEAEVLDEINVLKGLDHPHIVHVWDNFESRDK